MTKRMRVLTKFLIPGVLAVIGVLVLAACATPAQLTGTPPTAAAPAATTASSAASGEPIVVGVSGPLTGDLANYGAQWKKGFDLALEEINGAGGINGRPLKYDFEDSQSDPKQSVIVAQKFIADPTIVAELGDFASSASMAASPLYTRGGLVQFGFTNSHPDFTKPSDYQWSNSVTQDQESPAFADFANKTLGLKKLAVFQLNNDWGKSTYDLFAKQVTANGAQVVDAEQYLDSDKDFHSAITRIQAANPDGIVLISYEPDGALIAQQLQEAGNKLPLVGTASIQSPDYVKLGGAAVNGTHILGEFQPNDPRPEVKAFVQKYRAKYNEDPELFSTIAYDAMNIIADAIRIGGPTRQGIHDAMPKLGEFNTVLYGKVSFDNATRRILNPIFENLIVQDGAFVPWDGAKPTATP